MYTETGFGIIGAGAYEPVREAGAAFRSALKSASTALARTDTQPMPSFGKARLYAISDDGVFTAEIDENRVVMDKAHPLHAALMAGH